MMRADEKKGLSGLLFLVIMFTALVWMFGLLPAIIVTAVYLLFAVWAA